MKYIFVLFSLCIDQSVYNIFVTKYYQLSILINTKQLMNNAKHIVTTWL